MLGKAHDEVIAEKRSTALMCLKKMSVALYSKYAGRDSMATRMWLALPLWLVVMKGEFGIYSQPTMCCSLWAAAQVTYLCDLTAMSVMQGEIAWRQQYGWR